MTSHRPEILLVCPEHVQWVCDANQSLIVDERNGLLFRLHGAEAAVWDWLTLGYSYSRLVQLLAALLVVNPDEAECVLDGILSHWLKDNLLEEAVAARG